MKTKNVEDLKKGDRIFIEAIVTEDMDPLDTFISLETVDGKFHMYIPDTSPLYTQEESNG